MKINIGFLLVCVLIGIGSCKHRDKTTASTTKPQPQVQPMPPARTGPTAPNDTRVIIHEETLNKMLKALGKISGTEPYDLFLFSGTYTWTLVNPQIHLHPGKADFASDVAVQVGKYSYQSTCVGDVSVTYDRKKNMINVKITRAIFEIYTVLFGKKYHIKDWDLAENFPEPFQFEGPTATETSMEFTMPDSTVRTLYMRTTDCDLEVQEKQIVVPCEVEFTNKPAIKPPVAAPPQKK